MNIKYKFRENEKVSQPLTPISLFKEVDPQDPTTWGGLYPWNPSSTRKPANIFEQNIQLINQRISQITKQLTYWDLYKLADQVTSPSKLNSVFAALVPGQACVINCNSFIDNGQDYHRGDVVVKMLDGEAAYIPVLSSGFYMPISLDKDPNSNNYTLVFKYQVGELSESEKEKSFPLEASDPNDSFIYGILEEKPDDGWSDDIVFDNCSFGVHDIHPIIKLYTEEHEEVDVHVTATLNSSTQKWTIDPSNWPSIVEWVQIK